MSAVETTRRPGAVGVARPRVDAGLKVRGAASYASDRSYRGLLHGRPVLSPYAHARIVGVDPSEAFAVPGVHSVLFHRDLPVVAGSGRGAEPLAASEVVFAGQPVALVLAETEAAAEDGAALVLVDYAPLPAVVDLEAALDPSSPPARLEGASEEADVGMHGDAGTGASEADAPRSPNVVDAILSAHGDVESALAGCAAVASGRFRTSWIHQAPLEPQVAVAWPEGAGGLGVRTSTQSTFYVRQELAGLFGLRLAQVRVEAAELGGAFGSKLRLLEPLVAGAALAVSRPVRVAFTRGEDFAAANPGPGFVFDARVGADADGRLVALDARILGDNGAFLDSSPVGFAGGKVGGAYTFDAWRVETISLRTNRFGAGAYRAPSGTPGAFVIESLLDELAAQLELDPVELRLRNVPAAGDPRVDGLRWQATGLRETLEAVATHPVWLGRGALPAGEGVGVAAGLFPGGRQGAAATCRLDGDGGLTVVTGYVDMTGTDTAMAALAAEVVGVPADAVTVVTADSGAAPVAGISAGSMVTYCLGSAVRDAALDARDQILRVAADVLAVDRDELEIVDGVVRGIAAREVSLPLVDVARRVTAFGASHPPVEGHGTAVPPELAPSAAAALAHVRVDAETGEIEVLGYVAAQDCGRALNPALVEGQMVGGAVQSIGYALHEELVHDEEGQLLTASFLDYAIPRIEAVPEIETIVVEVPSPHGPLGARGIGESAIVPGAAAVANAIAAATDRRLRRLPMTPERVWAALHEEDGAA